MYYEIKDLRNSLFEDIRMASCFDDVSTQVEECGKEDADVLVQDSAAEEASLVKSYLTMPRPFSKQVSI